MKLLTNYLSATLATLFLSQVASAHPYDDSLPTVPNNVTSSGSVGRGAVTDLTYNIPISGWPETIHLTIKGGDGGSAKAEATIGSDQTALGGGGARLTATFAVDRTATDALRPGGELRVVVGNSGETKVGNPMAGGGGGGATGILYRAPFEGADWELLMLAGGGGGAAASTHFVNTFSSAGSGARTTTNGDRMGHSFGSTDGNSGISYTNGAGGGGGWLQNASQQSGGKKWSSGGTGGDAFDQGADGGSGMVGGGAGHLDENSDGVDSGGGGGGGYSGGGSGHDQSENYEAGGGGGSYIDSRALSPQAQPTFGSNSTGTAKSLLIDLTNGSLPAPTVTISGASSMTVYAAYQYTDAGATATDCYGNTLTLTTNIPAGLSSETPGSYQVSYTATDQFGKTTTVYRSVTVRETPTIQISNEELPENTTTVGILSAAGADADSLTFTIDGGPDKNLFEIDPTTHTLSFITAPDYETPSDSEGDNGYQYRIRATDAFGLDLTKWLGAYVINVNDNAPSLPTLSNSSINENISTVGTLSATDADGNAISYEITGGADAARFQITNQTLAFVSAPDFDSPSDANADNTYEIQIRTTDGELQSASRPFDITVNNLNDHTPTVPTISSNAVPENTTSVGTIISTDADGDSISYIIVGGTDSNLFQLVGDQLQFKSAPDYEAPLDSESNNSYQVRVLATDSENHSTPATFTIQVLNENDNTPTVPSLSNRQVAENSTAVGTLSATDEDGDAVSFEIVGGPDANFFTIIGDQLQFKASPDYDSPADFDANNNYQILVRSTDSENTSIPAGIVINVLNENDIAPTAPALSATALDENTMTIGTLSSTDEDSTTPQFRIIGGADSHHFALAADGTTLIFGAPQDFENPADANSDNVYEVQVDAWDGVHSTVTAFEITVRNLNDNTPSDPTLSNSSIQENNTTIGTLNSIDPDGGSVTYEIIGGADAALFSLQSNVLSFIAKPDFETPLDADKDNFYQLDIRSSDGELYSSDVPFTIEIRNVNDNAPTQPTLSNSSLAENTTVVGTLLSTDAEGNNINFLITGGDDKNLFSIAEDGTTLQFLTAPDFENPADANGDNIYQLTIVAADRKNSSPIATLSITVLDVDEAPTIPTLDVIAINEMTTTIGQVRSTDPEGNTLNWSLLGSADGALFSIDQEGNLSFISPPDFEAPRDTNTDNTYHVVVAVSDGGPSAQLATFSITVLDVIESALADFRSTYGLATDGSDDSLDWSNNGIPNIHYFAFGLGDPRDTVIDRSRLLSLEGGAGTHSIRYVRPAQGEGSGLEFAILASSNLDDWQDLEDLDSSDQPLSETTEDLGDGYERVTLLFSTQAVNPQRFYNITINKYVTTTSE
ncbi:hypothetical protein Rhal01_01165 [Rubritalea halochordaticola]|uniref:Cadherin domain-containing protein n=1 Tax=Rubritalea halochordaticola TaxID=714537 RepID=A0ABP9UX09_9BACT